MRALTTLVSQDPFVELEAVNAAGDVVGKKFKTKTIDKSLTPTWNETFTLDIDASVDHVSLEVRDKDMLKTSFMGQVRLAPSDFAAAHTSDKSVHARARARTRNVVRRVVCVDACLCVMFVRASRWFDARVRSLASHLLQFRWHTLVARLAHPEKPGGGELHIVTSFDGPVRACVHVCMSITAAIARQF